MTIRGLNTLYYHHKTTSLAESGVAFLKKWPAFKAMTAPVAKVFIGSCGYRRLGRLVAEVVTCNPHLYLFSP